MSIQSFEARNDDIGKRIDQFIAERADITRSASQKVLADGNVSVNSATVKKNYKISAADKVEVDIPDPEPLDALPENIPVDIVYEDEHLAVVNKPKGMVVHPAPGNYTGTLVNALLYHMAGRLSSINGIIRPGIVHRIDKNTSGLLMIAKTDEAHLGLAEQIKEHSFERCYEAILVGNLKDDRGTIDAPIGRHPEDRKKMAIVRDGREAITHYEVLERFPGFCHVRLKLETGRTHQIRVHTKSIGHGVLGDTLYGQGKTKFEQNNKALICEQCLHARTVGFVHPITKEEISFTSELPEYFTALLEKLRKLND
ncbi:MAG: RluA family pseudouridine synthase [Ruminococcaceae bacterium]|nr:RluA family pseudouridine synthase [Oscillospiraceae bacterium]